MRTNPLMLFICMAVLLGCKKEPTAQELLTGTWIKTKEESKTTNSDWQATNEACDLDDTEEFSADGKWALYLGNQLCSGQSGTVVRGNYLLAASDTKIIFTYTGISGEYESTIESISSNQLVLSFATGLSNGTIVRTTYNKR